MADKICIIPLFRVKCPSHPFQEVQRICISSDCNQISPFICSECLPHPEKHQVEEKDNFLLAFSQEIEHNVSAQKLIYDETIGRNENLSLLRWVEDCDNHMLKLNDYIKAQKFQIENDIEEFQKQITSSLKAIKDKSFGQFDAFIQTYRSSIDTFKLFKDDVFQLLQKHKHWANPNVVASKIQSLSPEQASKALQEVKKSISIAKETNAKSQDFVNHLHLSLKELNKLIDDLPSYSGSGMFQEELVGPLCKSIHLFYEQNMHVGSYPPITLSLDKYKLNRLTASRSSKDDSTSIFKKTLSDFFEPSDALNQLSMNQIQTLHTDSSCHNFHEVNWVEYQPMALEGKEISKISLNDNQTSYLTYTCFSYLGCNLLAIGGQELRIYDLLSKQTIKPDPYLINKHYSDIISIIPFSPMFQPLHLRNKIVFATSSSDSSVILWSLDQNKFLSSFQKLLGFLMPVHYLLDLGDGTSILVADLSNEITLLEYHTYKWCFSQKFKSKVSAMRLSTNEQVVVASEDGQIFILQMNFQYNQSSSFQVILKIDTGINGISSLSIIPNTWEVKTFFALGCIDGQVRIFDINLKQVVATFNSNSGALIDNVLVRESKKCAFSLVFCGKGGMNLKAQHFANSSQEKVRIEEQPFTTISEPPCFLPGQSKMQIIPSLDPKHPSPMLLILTETMKSILIVQINPTVR